MFIMRLTVRWDHRKKFLFGQDGNSQLLRFGQFAAGILTCQQIAGLFGNRGRNLAAVLFNQISGLFSSPFLKFFKFFFMFFPVEKESPLQKDIKNNILELYEAIRVG